MHVINACNNLECTSQLSTSLFRQWKTLHQTKYLIGIATNRSAKKFKPPLNLSRKHEEKKNFISRGLQSSKYGIDLTGKIFSYYAATYENHNGHNYLLLLLHYRSILPLSITCLVLF